MKGTTDVEHQIATKYSFHKVLARLQNGSETISKFLERMNSMRVKNSVKIGYLKETKTLLQHFI